MRYLAALIREAMWGARKARVLARTWGENMRDAIPDPDTDW